MSAFRMRVHWKAALLALCLAPAIQAEERSTVVSTGNVTIRDIGIPVRGVNWIRLLVARSADGAECLLATMGQQGDNLFVLEIDPSTGKCRQFISKVPGSNYPTAACLSRTGKLYIGSAYAGNLLCYDPAKGALDDLGQINGDKAVFPCLID